MKYTTICAMLQGKDWRKNRDMEQVHAPVKGKSSGKAADATADNNDAMGFLLHVSFLVYFLSPSPSMAIYLHPGRRPPRQN